MKAITVVNPGSDAKLILEEVPDPVPGPTDVLIRATHTSVNRADLLQARGIYPPPSGAPTILGLECSGTIDSLGEQAHLLNPSIQPGQHVMALLSGGGYAQKVAADIRCIVPIPPEMPHPQSGALLETYLTAYLNIFLLGKIRQGQRVLIHGGSGGVGTSALNLCKLAGIETIVTAGSNNKCEQCINRGAALAINYRTSDFSDEVARFTRGNGVDLVLDCIGASYLERNLDCLATEGKLVLIGLMGGAKAQLNLAPLLTKRVRVIGSTLRALPIERKAEIIELFQVQFGQHLANGELKPVIHKIVDLENAENAHKVLKETSHFGKVVLHIPS